MRASTDTTTEVIFGRNARDVDDRDRPALARQPEELGEEAGIESDTSMPENMKV